MACTCTGTCTSVFYIFASQDVQSKSKNLSDTMTYIKKKLVEEKEDAEKQLVKMSIDKSRAPHVNDRVGVDEEKTLRDKIVHHR